MERYGSASYVGANKGWESAGEQKLGLPFAWEGKGSWTDLRIERDDLSELVLNKQGR